MLKNFLTLVFCCLLLTGCAHKDKQEIITFSSWGSVTEVQILKKIISDFEKENSKYKVEFLHIPQNYFQKLHLLFASKTPPDVVFINNLNLPIYKDFLEEMSSYVDENDFYSQTIEGLKVDDSLYAIPRDISNLVVYVNTDKINLPSKNWKLEDLLNVNSDLPFVIGVEDDIYWALPYLSYFGGVICDEKGVVKIKDEKSQKGLSFYLDLRDKYKIAPSKSDIGSSTLAQMFLDEKIGFYVSGRWMYPKISEKAKFSWAVINFPYGVSLQPCDVSGWAISKGGKNKEGAIELVKYLSSPKSSMYFAQTGLIVPARVDSSLILNNDFHNEKVFLEVISKSKNTNIPKNYKKIVDEINIKYLK